MFNIFQFYMLITSVYVFSEQTTTFALYNINSLVFMTVMESVYSAVRTESLYNTDTLIS